MAKRRHWSEKDVIRTLIHQGVKIADFRTGAPITLENVDLLEREHLVELGLAETDEDRLKYDQPEYCRYTLKEAVLCINIPKTPNRYKPTFGLWPKRTSYPLSKSAV